MDASPTSPAAKKVDRKMVRCGWEQGPPKLRGLGHGSKRGGDGVAATKKNSLGERCDVSGAEPSKCEGSRDNPRRRVLGEAENLTKYSNGTGS